MKKFFEEMKEEREILEKFIIATFITNVGARFRRLGNKLKKKSRGERVCICTCTAAIKKGSAKYLLLCGSIDTTFRFELESLCKLAFRERKILFEEERREEYFHRGKRG